MCNYHLGVFDNFFCYNWRFVIGLGNQFEKKSISTYWKLLKLFNLTISILHEGHKMYLWSLSYTCQGFMANLLWESSQRMDLAWGLFLQKKHKVMVFGEEGFQQLSLCSEEFTFQQMTLPCHGQTREKKKRETMERVWYYNDFSMEVRSSNLCFACFHAAPWCVCSAVGLQGKCDGWAFEV